MSSATHHAVEQTVISVAGKTAGGSGAVAVGSELVKKVAEDPSVLNIADFGVWVGMAVGLSSLAIHAVANWRRDRRDARQEARNRELHRIRLMAIETGADPLLPPDELAAQGEP